MLRATWGDVARNLGHIARDFRNIARDLECLARDFGNARSELFDFVGDVKLFTVHTLNPNYAIEKKEFSIH
jgi:hypothetical protein